MEQYFFYHLGSQLFKLSQDINSYSDSDDNGDALSDDACGLFG
jgi:hypothetical protein